MRKGIGPTKKSLTAIVLLSVIVIAVHSEAACKDNLPWWGLGLRLELGGDQPFLFVQGLIPEGPGDQAGLVPGDVIQRIDNRPIEFTSNGDLLDWVLDHQPGDEVELEVVRHGDSLVVTVSFAELPPEHCERFLRSQKRVRKTEGSE